MSIIGNVDNNEVEKFDALAEQWWDETGPMKPLHALNPIRLGFIDMHTTLSDQTVCDIGCGGGILTEAMAQKGAIATGIDMSQQAISIAKQHAKINDIAVNYLVSRTEDFAQAHPEQFDIVTCMEMLEHVPDPTAIIAAAANLTKPNGLLFFSTLNRSAKAFMQAIIGAEYLLQMLPKGTHTYDKFIRPSELRRWAIAEHLTFVGMKGIDYHPLSQAFKLSATVDVNYLMVFKKGNLT